MKHVIEKPNVFISRKDNNPMDVLGIGSNMVRSLRYWLQAVGLTVETKTGKREQCLTDFGKAVWENDRYIEEMGTLWLIHYKLATNDMNATAWYYFFNEFGQEEFNKEDFVIQLDKRVKMTEPSGVAKSSLEGDFNCIISTYVSRAKSNPGKVHPENNIDCPLGELGLIDITNKKERFYKKSVPKKDLLHPLIVLAVILEQAGGQREIKISTLLGDSCNVGKVFNLDVIALMEILYKIQQLGYIRVIRTAGLDVIRIISEMSFDDCVKKYYESISA